MQNENPILDYRREMEVRYQPDVFVVGGGPAGVAASLAAARQGASVRLVEAHSCLGGMGTAGMVPGFSRFTDNEDLMAGGDGANFLAGGVGAEVLEALRAAGGTVPPDGRSIRAEVLKRVYDNLLAEAKIPFLFYTRAIDATVAEGRIREVVCAGKSGLFAVRAKVFLDCTGDGDIAALAGAPFEKGDADGRMMPGTLCSLWAGINWEAVERSGLGRGNRRIEEAIRDGAFTLNDRHLPGMWRVGDSVGGGNIGHTFDLDGTDEESLTRACVWGRKSLPEYERYYKRYLEGYERMELVATGSLLGVRESRRILADYVLNLDDFKRRAVFDDEIGRYAHPIDIHVAKPDKESYDQFREKFKKLRMGKGESYGIPYRALTPRGLDNLLVAGRCASSDRDMQASIRTMPCCYITGQAAGVAAALAAQEGSDIRSINIGELQARLKEMGAYLPNFRGPQQRGAER